MYSRTLCSLGLVAFTLILGLSLTLSPTNQPQHNRQLVGSPSHVHLADGGAPVPPVPKPPAPLPPGIAYSDYTMFADGGAPVPPVPPIKQPKTLVADGGAPVPPVPPIRPSNLMADGGAPVPPVPTPPMIALIAV